MSKRDAFNQAFNRVEDDEVEEEEYDTMELLERLETLREDMEELGVTTLSEVIQRIEDLHRQMDDR